MNNEKEFTKQQIIEALIQCNGWFYETSVLLGIKVTDLVFYFDLYPELKEQRRRIRLQSIEDARRQLQKKVEAGTLSMGEYLCYTQGKQQGFAEHQKQYWAKASGSGGVGVGVLVATDTPDPDDEIKTLGDRLANLSLAQWHSLLTYLCQRYKLDIKVVF